MMYISFAYVFLRSLNLDFEKWELIYSGVMHYKLKKVKKLIKENRDKLKLLSDQGQLDDGLRLHIHLSSLKKQISDELGIVILE